MSDSTANTPDLNNGIRILTRISDKTNVRAEMVRQICYSILKERKNIKSVDCKTATRFIILDIVNNDNGSVKSILQYNGITSSSDIGAVVKELCDEGLILKEANDDYNDFNGLFETEDIEVYIKNEKIKKQLDWYKIICTSLFFLGLILIITSRTNSTPNTIGWTAWGITLLGGGLFFFRKDINNFTKQISKKSNS